MKQPKEPLTRTRLKAPKAAAIAGIIFSVLLIIGLVLLLASIPANLDEGGGWLASHGNTILLALNLIPFSGIAFLWFMGVIRDRLGEYEDQFFATVFLGSGLLFLALLFSYAAVTGGIIKLYTTHANRLLADGFYDLGLSVSREIINTYAVKMEGVFMISTGTIFIRTKVIPRWLALLGYVLALFLLLRIGYTNRLVWISLVFPIWILLISLYILIDNYRKKTETIPTEVSSK
jgi:hypothetical protein